MNLSPRTLLKQASTLMPSNALFASTSCKGGIIVKDSRNQHTIVGFTRLRCWHGNRTKELSHRSTIMDSRRTDIALGRRRRLARSMRGIANSWQRRASVNRPLKNDQSCSGAAQAARYLLIKRALPDGSRRTASVFQRTVNRENCIPATA